MSTVLHEDTIVTNFKNYFTLAEVYHYTRTEEHYDVVSINFTPRVGIAGTDISFVVNVNSNYY